MIEGPKGEDNNSFICYGNNVLLRQALLCCLAAADALLMIERRGAGDGGVP